jgi:putative PIG3 family NAD(P)H quinone oxidoreductase
MALPAEMTAIKITAPGGPEMLEPQRLKRPEPGPGEILIAVKAAGVNRPDVFQRMGFYAPPPGAPDIPGLEIAGHVAACGKGAKRYKAGDAVMALVPGGGYAEYCLADEPCALPIPRGVSMVEAGSIPETFFTVWTNVFEMGALKPGERLLVHGGTSGIGTTAIMLAKAFGSPVFATAGSAEKCAACEKLGAARGFNYRTEDFAAIVNELTQGKGVDVVLDMVGGDYVARDFACMAPKGRHVSIATLGGNKVEISLRDIMMKRLVLTGSTLRARSVAEKGAIAAALEANVLPLLAKGQLRPVIDSTFPLAKAAEAHRRIEHADHIGKIVLTLA